MDILVKVVTFLCLVVGVLSLFIPKDKAPEWEAEAHKLLTSAGEALESHIAVVIGGLLIVAASPLLVAIYVGQHLMSTSHCMGILFAWSQQV